MEKINSNLISKSIYSHYNFHMKTQNLSRVSIPYKLISFAFYTCIPYFKDQNDIRYTINDIYQFLLKCTFDFRICLNLSYKKWVYFKRMDCNTSVSLKWLRRTKIYCSKNVCIFWNIGYAHVFILSWLLLLPLLSHIINDILPAKCPLWRNGALLLFIYTNLVPLKIEQ